MPTPRGLPSHGRNRGWSPAAGLPAGYAFDHPGEGSTWPVKAKLADGRMAVYWFFASADTTVEPSWRIARMTGQDELERRCAEINKRPSVPPPEPQMPSLETQREWADHRPETVNAPPPFLTPM